MELNGDKRIIDEYLTRCTRAGNNGAYYELMRDKKLLRADTLDFFKIDERGFKRKENELERISTILKICEQTLYDFLQELSRKERIFGWPKYQEPELKKRINTALQQS